MSDVEYVRVGMTVSSPRYPEVKPLEIPWRKYAQVYVIAQPRYGKGGVAKPLVVRVSKHRPVCIFDFKGEWSSHVTRPNYHSTSPDFIAEYRSYRDFTFKLSDFLNVEDWVSMGFHRAMEVRNMFVDTMHVHQGLPELFIKVLVDLPTETKGSMTLEEFNSRYDTTLPIAAHQETKRAWVRTMEKVKKWFWTGEGDPRRIYDFGQEWVEHRNIFIDFTTGEGMDAGMVQRNRTFFGKIMEKLQPYYLRIQGIVVVEEADILIPHWRNVEGLKPSSNQQMIYFTAKAPKWGMGCVLIMQNLKQSDEDLRMGGQFMYLLGMYSGYPYPFKPGKAPRLKYYPEQNYREFLFVDVNGEWMKFTPDAPCCEYESNVRGVDA